MSNIDSEKTDFENRYFTFSGIFRDKVMASLRKLFDSEKVEPLFNMSEQFSLKCSSKDEEHKKKIHDLIENFDWEEANIPKPKALRHGRSTEIVVEMKILEKIKD